MPLLPLSVARGRIVAVVLWIAWVLDAPCVLAQDGDVREIVGNTGLVVGPSVAWGRAGAGNQMIVGMDLTLREAILWQSVGIKVSADGPRVLMPYLEVGIWFLASLGVGYSMTITNGKSSDYFNVFLGIPLPSWDWDLPHLFTKDAVSFIEPYYRPAFRFQGDAAPIIHEAGLLLKVMYDFGP